MESSIIFLHIIYKTRYLLIAGALIAACLYGFFYWQSNQKVSSSQPGGTLKTSANTSQPTSTLPQKGEKVAAVDVLVEKLRLRLEAEPNDVQGWVLLAKSYHHLQRWQESTEAFKKAKALGYQGEPQPLPSSVSSGQRLYTPPVNSVLSQAIEQAILKQSELSTDEAK